MRLFSIPEFPLIMWGGLLNFAWELLQVPLFTDRPGAFRHIVWGCFQGTVGDVFILLAAFWLTSLLFRSRWWFVNYSVPARLVFVLTGLVYTGFSEWYHVHIAHVWSYGASMPLVIGIGLTPLLQWIIIPPIVLLLTYLTSLPHHPPRA